MPFYHTNQLKTIPTVFMFLNLAEQIIMLKPELYQNEITNYTLF